MQTQTGWIGAANVSAISFLSTCNRLHLQLQLIIQWSQRIAQFLRSICTMKTVLYKSRRSEHDLETRHDGAGVNFEFTRSSRFIMCVQDSSSTKLNTGDKMGLSFEAVNFRHVVCGKYFLSK